MLRRWLYIVAGSLMGLLTWTIAAQSYPEYAFSFALGVAIVVAALGHAKPGARSKSRHHQKPDRCDFCGDPRPRTLQEWFIEGKRRWACASCNRDLLAETRRREMGKIGRSSRIER